MRYNVSEIVKFLETIVYSNFEYTKNEIRKKNEFQVKIPLWIYKFESFHIHKWIILVSHRYFRMNYIKSTFEQLPRFTIFIFDAQHKKFFAYKSNVDFINFSSNTYIYIKVRIDRYDTPTHLHDLSSTTFQIKKNY